MEIEIFEDNDNCWTIEDLIGDVPMQIAYTSNRYCLGTEHLSRDQMEARVSDPSNWHHPVYAYVHSGATLSMRPFSCPWDSGKSGFVYGDKQALAKFFGHKKWCASTAKRTEDLAATVVRDVDLILQGEIYGYAIRDAEGNEVDRCSGFIGRQTAEEMAKETMQYLMGGKQ